MRSWATIRDWRLRIGALAVGVLLVTLLPPNGHRRALAATLAITPSSGPIGTQVQVEGSGFFADYDVRIYFGATGPTAERRVQIARAGRDESISTSFLVPSWALAEEKTPIFACSTPRGEDRCAVEPDTGTRAARTMFASHGSPFARLMPGQGEVDTASTLIGEKFASAVACGPVHVLFDGTPVADAEPSDTDGDGDLDIAASFTVPSRPPGEYRMKAIQSDDGCSVSPPFEPTYRVLSFFLDPISGGAGAIATALGEGFSGDVLECGTVRILFDGVAVGSATPNPEGTFSLRIRVPEHPPGEYVVVANQGRTCGVGGEILANARFTVPRLSPKETRPPPLGVSTAPPTPAQEESRPGAQPEGSAVLPSTTPKTEQSRAPVPSVTASHGPDLIEVTGRGSPVGWAVAALFAAVLSGLLIRMWRDRQRSWVAQHVRVVPHLVVPDLMAAAEIGGGASHAIRLVAQMDAGNQDLEERTR